MYKRIDMIILHLFIMFVNVIISDLGWINVRVNAR